MGQQCSEDDRRNPNHPMLHQCEECHAPYACGGSCDHVWTNQKTGEERRFAPAPIDPARFM